MEEEEHSEWHGREDQSGSGGYCTAAAIKGRITLKDNLDQGMHSLLWISVMDLPWRQKDFAGTGSALGETHWIIVDH